MTKSTKKPKPPPVLPPIPIPTPTFSKEFTIGGVTCEIISVHGKLETKLDTKTMRERGETAGADMTREDGEFLFKHRRDIPVEFLQTTLVFPQWQSEENTVNDGKIRTLDSRGFPWWCKLPYSNDHDWDNKCKLVRFSKLRLA
jgi:hypothetical protein